MESQPGLQGRHRADTGADSEVGRGEERLGSSTRDVSHARRHVCREYIVENIGALSEVRWRMLLETSEIDLDKSLRPETDEI